jgi:hypothetical protein
MGAFFDVAISISLLSVAVEVERTFVLVMRMASFAARVKLLRERTF